MASTVARHFFINRQAARASQTAGNLLGTVRPHSVGETIRLAFSTPHLTAILLVEIATLAYLWGSSSWLPSYLLQAEHFSIANMGIVAPCRSSPPLLPASSAGTSSTSCRPVVCRLFSCSEVSECDFSTAARQLPRNRRHRFIVDCLASVLGTSGLGHPHARPTQFAKGRSRLDLWLHQWCRQPRIGLHAACDGRSDRRRCHHALWLRRRICVACSDTGRDTLRSHSTCSIEAALLTPPQAGSPP